MSVAEEPGPAALIVAHPGHELVVFSWMERRRPIYCCLTDGSGGGGEARTASTAALLASAGARRGPIFGRFPDREVYAHLLAGRVEIFADLVRELAAFLIEERVERVAGDAAEGFNPTHDICRFLIDGAVELVRRRTGRALANDEFLLDARPDAGAEAVAHAAQRWRLDDAAVERKLAAALAYVELRHEAEAALARFGRDAYAVECLRPSTTVERLERFAMEPPVYERSGAIRVGEGRYRDVVRYREHVLPAQQAIARAAGDLGDG